MRRFFKCCAVILICGFTACSATLPGGLADSSAPTDYGKFDVLGIGQGQSEGTTVLGIQTSKPDLQVATQKAIASMNGDALVNVRWYVKRTFWVILPVVKTTVTVKGDVIKYKEASNEKL